MTSVTGLKCCAQGVDLLLKDCCKLEFFKSVLDRVASIVSFVKDTDGILAIYLEGTNLKLITPNPMQIATLLISAMRVLKVRGYVYMNVSPRATPGDGFTSLS